MIPTSNRREFIKVGLAAAAVAVSGPAGFLVAPDAYGETFPDVVITRGPDPAQNTRAAIKALGGIRRFVKPGNKVVLKPNMSFDRKPEDACNTNPAVVAEVARLCAEAGASRIAVLDNVLRSPSDCLRLSGIADACKDIPNTTVANVQADRLFRKVDVPQGRQFKSLKVMTEVVNADVLIAVPVGKSHSQAKVSLSMKGMMGLILERGPFHGRYELHDAIVDMVTVLKPHLVVIDGTRILSTGGPGGPGQVIPLDIVIASTDMVAADAQMVALGTWGGKRLSPQEIPHIRIAAERGLGRIDLDKLNIRTVRLGPGPAIVG